MGDAVRASQFEDRDSKKHHYRRREQNKDPVELGERNAEGKY
jgi:hypothetical protein